MGIAARQRRFVVRVFLRLDELSFKDDEPHLPEASGFEAPEYRLSPLLLSVKIAVPPDLETKPLEKARSWTWLSEAIGDACHVGILLEVGA